MKYRIFKLFLLVMCPLMGWAQINTDRVMTVGRNALYFEDYVLSIQYFNQVINAKPYLADPYFFRGLAKINLDDFQGAENDCSEAIERNPFVVSAYQVRGLARIQQDNLAGAIEDYRKALDKILLRNALSGGKQSVKIGALAAKGKRIRAKRLKRPHTRRCKVTR